MKPTPLDPIWDAVLQVADEGSVKGKVDYRDGKGTGRMTFDALGKRYTVYVLLDSGSA